MSDPNGTPNISRRSRRDGGGPGLSAARGAALVALAVILGIVLLQAIDDGNDGPVGDAGTTTTTIHHDDEQGSGGSSTSSTTTAEAAAPEQVTVRVLNGSGVAGAAGQLTNTLKANGYKTLVAGDATTRSGTVVDAKSDKTAECTTLADLIPGAKVASMPTPVPGRPGRRLHRRHRELIP